MCKSIVRVNGKKCKCKVFSTVSCTELEIHEKLLFCRMILSKITWGTPNYRILHRLTHGHTPISCMLPGFWGLSVQSKQPDARHPLLWRRKTCHSRHTKTKHQSLHLSFSSSGVHGSCKKDLEWWIVRWDQFLLPSQDVNKRKNLYRLLWGELCLLSNFLLKFSSHSTLQGDCILRYIFKGVITLN